ncbi:MAG: hypothetical protein ACAI25_14960, partial [Planctomycetota bacterium]
GEPDRTAAAFFARPLEVPAAPPRLTEGGLAALRAVAAALHEAIRAKKLSQPVIPRFLRLLDELEKGIPARATPHAAVLRASASNAIFGGRLLCEGRLRAGLIRFALVPLLAALGEGLFARGISESHLVANVALRMPSLAAALVPLEDRVEDVIDAVAALLAATESPSDTRV